MAAFSDGWWSRTMRWFSRNHDGQPVKPSAPLRPLPDTRDEARRAQAEARAFLGEVQAMSEKTRLVSEELREIRAQNHFAQRIEDSFKTKGRED